MTITFNIGNENKLIEIPNAISIYGGKAKEFNEIGIELFSDVFTNQIAIQNYIETKGWALNQFENKQAAKVNREKVNLFLNNVKRLFKAEVIEFHSSYKKGTVDQDGLKENIEYELTHPY